MRKSIKEWIQHYCKIHRMRIRGKPDWDYERNRWKIEKYITKTNRRERDVWGYYDKYTKAFKWILRQLDEEK